MATNIPKTMNAAAIDHFGGPEVLTIHSLPVPTPEAQEVLIAVHTCGVGRWDADMRGGWWPSGRPKFPLVLGTDGSGTIAALGPSVRRFQLGDKVYAFGFANPKGGFYAQYVAVKAENTALAPETLDLRHAGGVPAVGLTALQGIDDALQLKRGESIFIHGASGGVGTLAVQFAKLRGARVFATASGADGVRLVRRLGADKAVDGQDDIADAAEGFAPEGFDALLALVGTQLKICLDTVKTGGRVAYPNGVQPAPRKRQSITLTAYDGEPGVRQFQRLNRAIDQAQLRVPLAGIFRLSEAAKAHQSLGGHVLGKIVLRVR